MEQAVLLRPVELRPSGLSGVRVTSRLRPVQRSRLDLSGTLTRHREFRVEMRGWSAPDMMVSGPCPERPSSPGPPVARRFPPCLTMCGVIELQELFPAEDSPDEGH